MQNIILCIEDYKIKISFNSKKKVKDPLHLAISYVQPKFKILCVRISKSAHLISIKIYFSL